MARLPTAEALGVVNNAGSGGPMSSIQSNAMAEGVSALARSGQRLGAVLTEIGDQEDAFNTRIATASATTNLLKRHNEFQQQMRDNPDQYSNWEKGYTEHMQRAQQEAAATISDPRQRQLWASQHQDRIESWKQGVKKSAWERQRDSYMAQTQKDVDAIRQFALDPSSSEEDKAVHIDAAADMIEDSRRRGYITPQQAQEWSKKWEQGYALSRLEMMKPGERLAALGGTLENGFRNPLDYDATRTYLQNIDKAKSVNPDLVTVVNRAAASLPEGYSVRVNSGLRPGDPRQHGGATAMDVQIIGPDGKPIPHYQNAQSFRIYEQLAQSAKIIADRDFPTISGKFRWGGYFGGGAGKYGALDLMHFDVGGGSMGGGNWVNGLNEAQRKLWPGVQSKGLEAMRGTPSAIAQHVPPDQRERMLDRTRQEVDRGTREERVTVGRLVADDDASIRSTGSGVPELTRERVAQSLGKEAADKWEQGRVTTKEVFNATQGMEDMTDDQLRTHAERSRPTKEQAGEGMTQRQTVFDAVKTRADELLKQRADDPAQAVDASPGVVQARKALAQNNSLEAREALIGARLKQQEILGVPQYNRSPITVAEAKRYAAKMRPLASGQAEVSNQNEVIQGIVQEIETNYGKYAKEVLQRVLYQVTLKRDAAEVLSSAIVRMQKTDAGPLVMTEENRKLQQGAQARSIEAMGGGAQEYDPFDGGGYMFGKPPPEKFPIPSLRAVQLLESDSKKYMLEFIQKYGLQAVPRSMRFGPHADEMGKGGEPARPPVRRVYP